jgi:predicted DNA-binding WGR domain protein
LQQRPFSLSAAGGCAFFQSRHDATQCNDRNQRRNALLQCRRVWIAATPCAIQWLMTFLTRTDPTRNINRFYIVQVMPSLFGDWTVLREWGRRGSPGTVQLSSYHRHYDAEIAEQRTIKRRLQHGYRDPSC